MARRTGKAARYSPSARKKTKDIKAVLLIPTRRPAGLFDKRGKDATVIG